MRRRGAGWGTPLRQVLADLPPSIALDFQYANRVAQACVVLLVPCFHQRTVYKLVDRRNAVRQLAAGLVVDDAEQVGDDLLGLQQCLQGRSLFACWRYCRAFGQQGPFDEQQVQLFGRGRLDFGEEVMIAGGRFHGVMSFLDCKCRALLSVFGQPLDDEELLAPKSGAMGLIELITFWLLCSLLIVRSML